MRATGWRRGRVLKEDLGLAINSEAEDEVGRQSGTGSLRAGQIDRGFLSGCMRAQRALRTS